MMRVRERIEEIERGRVTRALCLLRDAIEDRHMAADVRMCCVPRTITSRRRTRLDQSREWWATARPGKDDIHVFNWATIGDGGNR
ncbi:hypothetical protein [Sinorhizobium medicae]|uniref:hypothetical protein n=1 Tax=Sinorhizobium medicae TaxID=110321 RepID=UPI00299CEA21|nr:hypothetical protein [Sinorhizobium medicae]MDX0451244.1 hypothetical protein [Sinorhizobium medicae]MDX0531560.1 hypothetical protein [Sinorhizobium medicae]MDX0931269.1 hypothetical protein [Sinorhizobium medicae]MDX1060443.1 hypothetical protein [Sinorhizobium medicae]WQO56937.1 hypothetical protein U8C36_36975 [Sinorhizobium medicae]